MVAELLTHYDASSARDHFRAVVREAVRDERPVLVKPRDEEAVVVLARAQLLELLAPYQPHIEILPEDEEGGFTVWIAELRATAYGATFALAREAAVDEAITYVQHLLREWPRLKQTDRAQDLPYIARLSLASTREEFRALLFSRLETPARVA
jgi:hypothetical protein